MEDCQKGPNLSKCLKIYVLKAANRAAKLEKFNVTDGVQITMLNEVSSKRSPKFIDYSNLQALDESAINELLWDSLDSFLGTHQLQLKIPKVDGTTARGRRKDRYFWGIIATLVIKFMIMTMSYKGVAAMSGAALILGKMALVLSAILGLKKLLSGHDKTTFEIVKHPHHTSSHSYSNSNYEESEGNQYHRSYVQGDDYAFEKAYRGQIPKYR